VVAEQHAEYHASNQWFIVANSNGLRSEFSPMSQRLTIPQHIAPMQRIFEPRAVAPLEQPLSRSRLSGVMLTLTPAFPC
jgi:hypothetical protein